MGISEIKSLTSDISKPSGIQQQHACGEEITENNAGRVVEAIQSEEEKCIQTHEIERT